MNGNHNGNVSAVLNGNKQEGNSMFSDFDDYEDWRTGQGKYAERDELEPVDEDDDFEDSDCIYVASNYFGNG